MERRTFLRLVGQLRETDEFEPGVGWETERVSRRPRPDPDYRLELVDADENAVAEGPVELHVPICRVQGADAVPRHRLVGYVALHPKGRAILLRRGERILHRAQLAPSRPRVTAIDINVGDEGKVSARWEAEHDRPLRFNLMFVDARQRVIPLQRALEEREISLDTTELPGGMGCSLAVLATDGLRSAMARSETFDLPERPPRVSIVSPAKDETVPADQPISLLGCATDLAGQTLPEAQLAWSVDGEPAGRGHLPPSAGPLEPGDHLVELAYTEGDAITAQAQTRITVSERTPEQRAWLAVAMAPLIETSRPPT